MRAFFFAFATLFVAVTFGIGGAFKMRFRASSSGMRSSNSGCRLEGIMDDDSDEFQALCIAIGLTVFNWAQVEQALDVFAAIAFHECGGDGLGEDIPRSLTRKVAFLRKCLNRLPKLSGFKKEGLSLLSKISEGSRSRHNLVHSVAMNISPQGGSYRLVKFDYERARHTVNNIDFSLSDFPALAKETTDLATESLNLVCRVGFHLGVLEGSPERPHAKKRH